MTERSATNRGQKSIRLEKSVQASVFRHEGLDAGLSFGFGFSRFGD